MAKHILVVLSADPPAEAGGGAALEAWSREHVTHMIEMPGIESAQAFRLAPMVMGNGAAPPTQPPYRNLCIYELADGAAEKVAAAKPKGDGAEGLTPPGGMGPNRPDGFIFMAVTEKYTRA